jgi:CPA1 family monovalent cation:H+ antiporter
LAGSARLSGVEAARRRLADLGLDEPIVSAELDAVERSTRKELARIELTDDEELVVVTRRGLFVERETYQHLSDAGLLPPAATRTLLHEVDDQIEEMSLGWTSRSVLRQRDRPLFDRFWERFTGWLPEPVGEDPAELAYAEASARRLAARRTAEALDLFARLPNIKASSVEGAKETFARWEQEAVDSLSELDRSVGRDTHALQRRQAEALSRVASTDALHDLADIGLLPEVIARQAAEAVEAEVSAQPGGK